MTVRAAFSPAAPTSFAKRFCKLAAVALVALQLGSCGGGSGSSDVQVPEPEVIQSTNGTLTYTLTQAPAQITVGGTSVRSNVYNGRYIPPVFKLARGDTLNLTVVNRLGAADVQISGPQTSNTHFHGMNISPSNDNVFLSLQPGARYSYQWQVPTNHPQGLYWIHPHDHGLVEPQVLSGMAGMLVVDGLVSQHYPAFAGLKERNLLLKDFTFPGFQDGEVKTKTINGTIGASIQMRPGEMQVWNLGNFGADAYFNFAVAAPVQLWEIGHDGNVLEQPQQLSSVFLPPGARSVVVVVAPSTPGTYSIDSLNVDTGPAGDPNPTVNLAKLVVSGDASTNATSLQYALTQPAADQAGINPTADSVEALAVTNSRTLIFSESDDGNTFYIDSGDGRGPQIYDPDYINIAVTLGAVERWTILNTSTERHVFHIHQLDFLVESINGDDPDEAGLRDVIDLPYAQNGVPGEVVLKIPFNDPTMVGNFVYHCHIVGHEDAGMMANLSVNPSGSTAALGPARMRLIKPEVDNGLWTRMARWVGLEPPVVVALPDAPVCRTPVKTTSVGTDKRQRSRTVPAASDNQAKATVLADRKR